MTPTPDIGQRPAYPVITVDRNNPHSRLEATLVSSGLTTRQVYKLAALQGLLANPQTNCPDATLVNTVASIADAMIAEDSAHAARQQTKG